MTTDIAIDVDEDGKIQFIYDDRLNDLLECGEPEIIRASHVEPKGNQWFADLAPVGGPLLGPFRLRERALAAEVEWLLNNL